MRRITFAILTILCLTRLSVEARENISVQEPQMEQTTENVGLKTDLVLQSENEKRDVIRKCCPLGKAYNYIKRRCLHYPGVFDPPLYENRGKPVCGVNVTEKYKVISGFIKCLEDKEMKVMNRAKVRYLLTVRLFLLNVVTMVKMTVTLYAIFLLSFLNACFALCMYI